MGPQVQREEVSSQATPLAEDVLAELQGQIGAGQFGAGVSPLQRQAGTAIQQYVASLQGGGTAGQVQNNTANIMSALTQQQQLAGEQGRADIIESVSGATGGRFGTAVSRGVGDFQAQNEANFAQQLAQVLQGQYDRETQARQFDVGALGQGIAAMQSFGNQNIQPFLQLAQLGILPEELLVTPGIGQQILAGALDAGAAHVGRPQGLAPASAGA